MSMAGTPPTDGADDAKLSWSEREMLTALRRLANAQLQVAQVDELLERQPALALERADATLVQTTAAELDALAKKARSRFGGGSARARVAELESRQRVVLDRLGFESYDAFVAAGAGDAAGLAAPEPVDPVVVEFARRELLAAEAAYRELLELPDDPDDELASAEPR